MGFAPTTTGWRAQPRPVADPALSHSRGLAAKPVACSLLTRTDSRTTLSRVQPGEAMLHLTTTILTTSLLLHTVLGCCWHHEHAGAGVNAMDAGCWSAQCSGRAQRRHASHVHADADSRFDGEAPRNDDSRPRSCHGERCTFVATKAVGLTKPQTQRNLDSLPACGSLQINFAPHSVQRDRVLADVSTSAGVRLRTQIWRL